MKGDVSEVRKPSLLFQMALPKAPSGLLIVGTLTAKAEQSSIKYSATSGTIRNQFWGAEVKKGKGQLPASKQQKRDIKYFVQTSPIAMPNIRGINGNFYPILPSTVLVNNVSRGDFGVHADKNVPGSSGCVVIVIPDHWVLFELWLGAVRSQGHSLVELVVEYS